MGLNRISIDEAVKVYNIYSALLENNRGFWNNSYSALNGYDIYDVYNSLNLLIAYHVFNTIKWDENKLKLLVEFANHCQQGINSFHLFFIPEKVYSELINYDYKSENWHRESYKLLNDGDYLTKDFHNFLEKNLETTVSFLNFCLDKICEDNTYYWTSVYQRLNLVYIKDDEKTQLQITLSEYS